MRISYWSSDVCSSDLQPHVAEILRIEHRQPLGKQFAVDHALAQPRNDAKTDTLGELPQRLRHASHVARLDMLEAVPEHDPIDRRAVRFRAHLARLPDQLRIEARPRYLVAVGDRKSTRLNSSH